MLDSSPPSPPGTTPRRRAGGAARTSATGVVVALCGLLVAGCADTAPPAAPSSSPPGSAPASSQAASTGLGRRDFSDPSGRLRVQLPGPFEDVTTADLDRFVAATATPDDPARRARIDQQLRSGTFAVAAWYMAPPTPASTVTAACSRTTARSTADLVGELRTVAEAAPGSMILSAREAPAAGGRPAAVVWSSSSDPRRPGPTYLHLIAQPAGPGAVCLLSATSAAFGDVQTVQQTLLPTFSVAP